MNVLDCSRENPMRDIVIGPLHDELSSRNTDKAYHSYTTYYDLFFRRLRDKEVKILEIGTGQTAAGLDMFSRYFPKAVLYGVDIVPEFKNNEGRFGGRLKIFIGDQIDREFLLSVMDEIGEMDVIIDDGGHYMDQQIATFNDLYPRVSSGGVYIIEDLFTSYEGTWVKDQHHNTMDYLKHLMDLMMGRVKRTAHIASNDFERYFLETVEGIFFASKIGFIFKKGAE